MLVRLSLSGRGTVSGTLCADLTTAVPWVPVRTVIRLYGAEQPAWQVMHSRPTVKPVAWYRLWEQNTDTLLIFWMKSFPGRWWNCSRGRWSEAAAGRGVLGCLADRMPAGGPPETVLPWRLQLHVGHPPRACGSFFVASEVGVSLREPSRCWMSIQIK